MLLVHVLACNFMFVTSYVYIVLTKFTLKSMVIDIIFDFRKFYPTSVLT